MLRLKETVEVKNNLKITIRNDRGKLVGKREGHNIWLNIGREYLASLIAYSSYTPLAPERNDRIRYMGLGIGGTRQLLLSLANSPPLDTAYPGTNTQTDQDPTVTQLERPVRLAGSVSDPPYDPSDVWLGQVQAPAIHTTPTEVTFRRLFSQTDLSYGAYLSVPLSEIGLFTAAADVNSPNNSPVAYDTFDSFPKTAAFSFEVVWTVRF